MLKDVLERVRNHRRTLQQKTKIFEEITHTYQLVFFFLLWNFRLYSKGRVLSHKRAKRNTRPNTSLVQIEGVSTKEEAQFYLGKRVAYIYRAKREVNGSKVRVIWG